MTAELSPSAVGTHGLLLKDQGLPAPDCVTEFDVNARLTFTNIKAHEYIDGPETLRLKVEVLASMIRDSQQFITYTGAGISTAAGIDDYATKAKGESVTAARPVVKDWKNAQPTLTHRVLTALEQAGHLKHWIQQNHDSLPQKAGYPQHKLNEIHGSLHDPANPIVPYEGSLRDDLFAWMQEWQEKSDLCLALGTSLSGFNADSVVESSARRFHEEAGTQGLVIVNLQQTPYDDWCSLRIFAKCDDVMGLLAQALGISGNVQPMGSVYAPRPAPGSQLAEDVFSVPFDDLGRRLQPNGTSKSKAGGITWDLRIGQCVRLTGGPYEGDVGQIVAKSEAGHYRLRFEHSVHPVFKVKRRPFSLWLGAWWIEQATYGLGITPGGLIPFVPVPEELGNAGQANHSRTEEPSPTPDGEIQAEMDRLRRLGLPEAAIQAKSAGLLGGVQRT